MPLPSDQGWSPRARARVVLQRGVANTSTLELRLRRSVVPITAATYQLLSPTRAVIYSQSPATLSGGVASVEVPAASLPSTLLCASTYIERWVFSTASGDHVIERRVSVARQALHCPVTTDDLDAVYGNMSARVRSQSGEDPLQDRLDDAWGETLERLASSGVWPEALVDSGTLGSYVKHLALAKYLRWMAFAANGSEKYRDLATDHERAAEKAWAEVRFVTDYDQDGIADSEIGRSPMPVVSRLLPPRRRVWRWSTM